jgi:hypothetical protein
VLKRPRLHVDSVQSIEVTLTDNFDQHANQVNSLLGHFDDSYIDPSIETEARPVEFESYSQNIQSLLLKLFSNSSIPMSFTEDILKKLSYFLIVLHIKL